MRREICVTTSDARSSSLPTARLGQVIARQSGGGKPRAEELQNLPHQHFLLKTGSQAFRHVHSLAIEKPGVDHRNLYERCQKLWMRRRNEIESEIVKRLPAQKVLAEVINDWE